MQTSVIGYPRIGKLRELKFAEEKYWRGDVSAQELADTARTLRAEHWQAQSDAGIDLIASGDFSYYDGTLDTAVLLGAIPARYRELGLSPLDTYFAMARGYQGEAGDVKALAMKKWFNTNYHYNVPEVDDDTEIALVGTKPFDEYLEAKALSIQTKPVVLGPLTFTKLARFTGKKDAGDFEAAITAAYAALLSKFNELGATWVQLDEPWLVHDLSTSDVAFLCRVYDKILASKGSVKVLIQTYFGDVRDCYAEICALDVDGIGLDFLEGRLTAELVAQQGLPEGKVLFAGLINGKNIWRNHYAKTLDVIDMLRTNPNVKGEIALSTSCSLLHVPYTLDYETKLSDDYKAHFAFATEKLAEMTELTKLADLDDPRAQAAFKANATLVANRPEKNDASVQARVAAITAADFTRTPKRPERERTQKAEFGLPLFPTTTIGSFPQSVDVRANRARYRRGEIDKDTYESFIRAKIRDCVEVQEQIGLDVLVHGEYERNDMVEYFGEQLKGFLFTQKAWVQSYGSRCVKPPIVWGDISRPAPMTIKWISYAQSCTKKPLKGMLTGPVTILNWSFPREDVPNKTTALQLALALRDEVLDLEAAGIKIIQVDEAALREKLPQRKSDYYVDYLNWAIPAFRLVHSGLSEKTQLHTHMCYSEFSDIIGAIDAMDADVITFEASRSDLQILDSLKANNFQTEVGPGVYDIHSPRIPSTNEIVAELHEMVKKIDVNKLWVNPDCGLKTRGIKETKQSLEHLVAAARILRSEYEA